MLVAQLSDIHLKDEPSFARLERVLQWVRTLRPDAIAVSGDLANHTHAERYTFLKAQFEAFGVPFVVVPGNVDDREAMRAVFGGPEAGPLNPSVAVGADLRLIGLDVQVPGAVHGDAAPVIDWLRTELAEAGPPALIFLHQHPFDSGLEGREAIACRHGDQLAAVIEAAPGRVLGISCGHLHRPMFTRFAGLPATLAPAIAKPGGLEVDGHRTEPGDPPGLLVHHLRPNGLVTHVVSLGE